MVKEYFRGFYRNNMNKVIQVNVVVTLFMREKLSLNCSCSVFPFCCPRVAYGIVVSFTTFPERNVLDLLNVGSPNSETLLREWLNIFMIVLLHMWSKAKCIN